MSNHRGVCNGCLLSLVASVSVGFGSNLVKQELTLAQSPVNKEAMPAAGYAYASIVRKTSVQSALVTKSKAKREQTLISEVRQLNSIERPLSGTSYVLKANRVKNFIVQISQATTDVVSVTDVKVNNTDKGIDLILVTPNSDKLSVSGKTEGNSYIANIPNAQLQLANGESFQQSKPVAGIERITVANADANTLRVTVVGEKGAPAVELFDSQSEGLVFGVTPAVSTVQQPTPTPKQQPPIELQVIGEAEGSYNVPDATTATKTPTPLRDIPQSIQVVPRQSWEAQGAVNAIDALRSVGVIQAFNSPSNGDVFTIRGFQTTNILHNGLKDYVGGATTGQTQLNDIEQIEVLRGPASVLYGQGNPGGTINFITKQPLSEPYFAASMTVGSYSLYQPTLDISGPLNSDKTLLYRLNVSYFNTESFVDFFNSQRYLIAPVVSWQIDPNTKVTFETEFRYQHQFPRTGLPAVGTVLSNPNGKIPLSLNTLDVNAKNDTSSVLLGYNFEHRFNDNWYWVNAFKVRFVGFLRDSANSVPILLNDRTLRRSEQTDIGGPGVDNEYALDNHVTGKFKIGGLQNELVAGFDLYRELNIFNRTMSQIGSIDVFNPVYGQPIGAVTSRLNQKTINDDIGLYVQDLVTLAPNLKLVLGGRGDFVQSSVTNFINSSLNNTQPDQAFSPRVGLVYQPIQPISLYASYSQSFSQNIGTTFGGSLFKPSTGTQYEVGVKGDFLSGRLSSTLALYQLTLSNVLTPDPNRPTTTFQIQTGEQRSRGIELNVTGEILPGWNVIASYAYTDAQVTKDSNLSTIGNRLPNVPFNSASLWTTYTFSKSSLQGLGFGLGLFYVGQRQGDLNNAFSVPSYLRTDAAVYYQRDHLGIALNFKNLFNVQYFTPRTIQLVYPEDPFTVQGTVSWKF
ncbi:MAG: TonB-dependent siderophore receptor [Nostoc sp.]|uniref:TonB-dependent siderophore receptor n=1 Tax=Nostoc sp. TaxID=1180 RepID=UPI002FF8E411